MASAKPNLALLGKALEHGVRLHQAGDLRQAEAVYRQILQIDAGNADATHLLGMIALASGDAARAIDLIRQAIERAPDRPHFHANLGNAFRESGQFAQAVAAYERALAAGGESPEVLNNLGIVRLQLGADADAVTCFERSLAVRPGHAGALTNLASALTHLGRFEEASACAREACVRSPDLAAAHAAFASARAGVGALDEACDAYRRAIALAPGFVEAHIGLAATLGRTGDTAAALAAAEGAVHARPADHAAWVALGVAQLGVQDHEQAAASFERAIAAMPGFAPAYTNLGVAYSELGRHVEAVGTLLKASELSPSDPAPLRNLAVAYHAVDAQDHAMDAVRRALEIAPDDAASLELMGTLLGLAERPEGAIEVLAKSAARAPGDDRVCGHLGLALERAGRFDEAHEQYYRALQLAPTMPIHHLRLATMQLRRGDFVNGWREYEHRLEFDEYVRSHPSYDLPRWHASQARSAETVILSGEQGFGDVFQFVRFATRLRERCGRVVLHVREPVSRLMHGVDGVDEVRVIGQDVPKGDAWLPMMSLPFELGLRSPEEVPSRAPYLRPDLVKSSQWRRVMDAGATGPRVGLVWSGNPKHHLDRSRSIPADVFRGLAEVPDIAWYSLQKGRSAGDLEGFRTAGWDVRDLGAEFADFSDTAAAIANLDLVIAVDTAVAHLAGALGKGVWILNHFVAEWRWLHGRADTPWYPTARLFKQPARGDWTALIAEVARELRAWSGPAAERRANTPPPTP